MTVSLYCAFTLEAYFNHIGPSHYAIWPTIEPKLGPGDKLAILDRALGIKADTGKRPWQTFGQIMDFRNALAHGKSVVLEMDEPQRVPRSGKPVTPMPDWEKLCTLPAAQRVRVDTRQMIEQMHKLAGFTEAPFAHKGMIFWEVHPARPNDTLESTE